ncbi:MAG: hypothetical protein RLZZ422_1010 [Pseudomonadota bacterium]|jgi:hypothetical protein
MKSLVICSLLALAFIANPAVARRLPPDLQHKVELHRKFKLPIPPVCLTCPPIKDKIIKEEILNPKVLQPQLDKIKAQGAR